MSRGFLKDFGIFLFPMEMILSSGSGNKMKKEDKEAWRLKCKRLHERLLFIAKGDRIIRQVVFVYLGGLSSKGKFFLMICFLIASSELFFFLLLFLFLYTRGKKQGKIRGWPSKEKNIIEKIEYLFYEVPLYLVILHYVTVWLTFIFFVFFM